MSRDYRFFIKDIIGSIEQIEKFTLNISFNEFVLDDMISSAVIGKLEIIGEASKNISEHTRMKYNNLPWSDMAKMRDKLIHAYFGVDYEVIWKVIKERLPLIKQQLRVIINELG